MVILPSALVSPFITLVVVEEFEEDEEELVVEDDDGFEEVVDEVVEEVVPDEEEFPDELPSVLTVSVQSMVAFTLTTYSVIYPVSDLTFNTT